MELTLLVIIASLIATIVLVRRGIEIGISLFITATVIALIMSPKRIPEIMFSVITSSKTWFLASMSCSIAVFAELYRNTKLIEELGIGLTRALKSSKIALMLIPAVIGLIPVAGGALMSAPIVYTLSRELEISKDIGVYINVWFRHTIFLFYPISQLIIIASILSGYPVELLALRQLPVAVFMILIGYFASLRSIRDERGIAIASESRPLRISALPLTIALVAAVSLKLLMGNYGMVIGVITGIAVLLFLIKPSLKLIYTSVFNRRVRGITLAAFSIIYLQTVFTMSGAAELITKVISQNTAIPMLLLEFMVPGFLGALTGSPLTGFVLSLPIFSGLKSLSISDVNIIYISSYVNYIGSPAHLCYIYTAEYFNVKIDRVYRYLAPSIALTLIFSLIIFSLV